MDGIKRFTSEYIIPEDRIRLSVETNDGQVRLLWLTRRLSTRLVKQIAEVLDKRPKIYGRTPHAPSSNAQRRKQMDALGKLESQEPVRGEEAAESHLITMVSMRMNAQTIVLDFKEGEDNLIQTIPFPEAEMRQWLVILNIAFRRGQWADDVWPDWISVKGGEKGPDPVRLN